MATQHIPIEIREAENLDELHAIQRFKYDVYVAEMDRYGDIADHENKRLAEDDDANSHNFLINSDGKLAGTMRLTLGADGALGDRQIAQYDLEPFLKDVPIEQIIVGERFMIRPEFRGTDVLLQMFARYFEFVNERRIQLIFGDCEPHLLNTYQALGFRTYTDKNVNSAATGYLIPLVFVVEDVDYLRRIASPLAEFAQEFADDARVPENIDTLLAGGAAVQTETLADSEDYLASIRDAAAKANALKSGLFANMDEAEILACIEKSVLITCKPGDRVIKKGNVAKNMCMALSGCFSVENEGETIAEIVAGDVFGEIAFFLKHPRTMDVVAKDDQSKMISFNDRTMRKLIAAHPEISAKLLYNISVVLCERLDAANQRM